MSWRREERTSRWEDRDRADRDRERWERDRRRSPDRRDDRRSASTSPRRDRDRDRRRRRRHDDVPPPPSPPNISISRSRSRSRSQSQSRSRSRDRDRTRFDEESRFERDKDDSQPANASPGDWYCKCGLYNFKRRQVCYRRNCDGKRSEGVVFGGDIENRHLSESSGITKCLRFRRLDALTTEEKILEVIKERCSKSVLDSIAGITIGREALTGASKCLAYINFNSIADSTAAHSEIHHLQPPLEIDGRNVLVSFYNGPKKPLPKTPDYSSYYSQMASYNNSVQQANALSEADRVNAAAAVAQSAISAAQARSFTWTPVSTPTFTTNITPPTKLPTGDGKTVYTPPDVRTFMYDEHSGYYYDPATGLYYDGNTQYFFNNQINQYMYWDGTTSTYILAPQNQQNTEAKTETETVKVPEEKKKKDKEDKVKVAKKIAKDMERWARTLNQKKENAKSNIVMEQVLDNSASKGSVDIGFSVLSAGPSITTHVRELSPPPIGDDFLVKKVAVEQNFESDDNIIDWAKLTCLLCKRKFPSADVLNKHKTMSELHKQNLAEFQKKNDLLPQTNGYRDRAAERRMKFGEDETPIIRKRYEIPEAPVIMAPPPSVKDTIGGKMLQKMGWSEGRGLGKSEQGRIAPIEAEQRPTLAGLGQKRGIYTPTPGETYRDTVKKLMIARYKEVVGQEDGKCGCQVNNDDPSRATKTHFTASPRQKAVYVPN